MSVKIDCKHEYFGVFLVGMERVWDFVQFISFLSGKIVLFKENKMKNHSKFGFFQFFVSFELIKCRQNKFETMVSSRKSRILSSFEVKVSELSFICVQVSLLRFQLDFPNKIGFFPIRISLFIKAVSLDFNKSSFQVE